MAERHQGSFMMRERNTEIDILRGILIVCVVLAHYSREFPHDIIFLFHMPLFFVISGFLMNRERLLESGYIVEKVKSLMLPYGMYLVLDMLLVRKTLSIRDWIYAIWGGRVATGVYWYITCFLFTLFLLSVLIRNLPDKMSKFMILVGGIAIIESHLVDKVHLLQSPGIPWNLDVALMALVYVGIGFFYKDYIKELLKSESRKYDLMTGMIAAALIVFCCFIYRDGNRLYYFDMKPVYYKELISAILIPCAFGIVLVRLVHWMGKEKWLTLVNRFLILCGQATVPIMFMHIPLNHWKDSLGYGRIVFLVIGTCVPLAFTLIFNRYKFMRKLFGLPKL